MVNILYNIKNKTLQTVKDRNVMYDLYEQRAVIPTEKHINNYLSKNPSSKIKKFFDKHGIKNGIFKIKQTISKIDYKIPLYHEASKNLYIIHRNSVYNRVVYGHYRFPTNRLIKILKKRKKKLDTKVKSIKKTTDMHKNLSEYKKDDIRYTKKYSDVFLLREHHKLDLMINFLNSFDIDTLFDTYVKVFYYYANDVGKDITICLRPSFKAYLSHITPYYTRSELINMALNMGIIKQSDKYYDMHETIDSALVLYEVIKEKMNEFKD